MNMQEFLIRYSKRLCQVLPRLRTESLEFSTSEALVWLSQWVVVSGVQMHVLSVVVVLVEGDVSEFVHHRLSALKQVALE